MRLEFVRTARWRRLVVLAAMAMNASCPWRAGIADEALIPYEKFKLDNGLTVIVHTDRKAPIVSVNLWYHVGSKNERLGKTGFAHLFEHLMFQGSENYNDEFFKPMEEVGATSINGTTNFDRTNYFQNVPTTALELALWMESDRMGHLLGAIDQARLDEQRGVVKNEKRQGENQPYGRVFASVVNASFPADHPYHWLPIGSMEDLDAASLDDVKEWFRTYYGAANAVLVLAGDIDVATARTQAQKYFGHIPPGPAITRPETWVAARTESTRETMYDQVAQTRLHRFWNTPEDGTTEADLLVLAGEILGSGKTSRLYERLVYRDQIADSASAGQSALEIAGLFGITADVKSGVDERKVEAAIEEELRRFMTKGPTKAELDRARMAVRSSFIKGLERIGGFGGKADVLASCEVYEADPGCYRRSLRVVEEATPEQLRLVVERWLAQGDYTLEVRPFPAYHASATDAVDRSRGLPVIDTYPDLAFPTLERAKLANGIPVILASRPNVPVVRVATLFNAGYAADREPKLGAFELHDGDARRGRGPARRALDRGSRQDARRGFRRQLLARHLRRRSLGAQRAPRRVGRPACDAGARPDVPAARDRSREARMDRRDPAREGEPRRARAPSPAAAALRRRASVCHPVLGLGHGDRDRSHHPRGSARVPARLAATGQRHAHRGRRHDTRGDSAGAREAFRRVVPAGDTAAGQGYPRGHAALLPRVSTSSTNRMRCRAASSSGSSHRRARHRTPSRWIR